MSLEPERSHSFLFQSLGWTIGAKSGRGNTSPLPVLLQPLEQVLSEGLAWISIVHLPAPLQRVGSVLGRATLPGGGGMHGQHNLSSRDSLGSGGALSSSRTFLLSLRAAAGPPRLMPILAVLAELGAYGLILYWTAHYFELEINWEKKQLESKTGESRYWVRNEQQGAPLPRRWQPMERGGWVGVFLGGGFSPQILRGEGCPHSVAWLAWSLFLSRVEGSGGFLRVQCFRSLAMGPEVGSPIPPPACLQKSQPG